LNNIKNDVFNALKTVIKTDDFTALHIPIFDGNEICYLTDCIESNFVSSVGEYVNKFEKAICDFTGSEFAILTVNGTAALHVSLLLAGVKSEEEVLIPSLTFIATANAVSYVGAIPHFVDVNEETLGIDPTKLDQYLSVICNVRNNLCYNKSTGRIIRTLMPMHTFGHPVDMDELIRVADKYNLIIVEDAAESLGSYYKKIHTGRFGRISSLSFNGNKIITTGGGGCILTNDSELAYKAKHITTTAKKPHPWEYEHDMVGYNYRMPALNAALGFAQLEALPKLLKQKRALAKQYEEAFRAIDGVDFFVESSYAKSNYWLNAIILNDNNIKLRNEVLKITNENGIMTRPVWKLMHQLNMFAKSPKMELNVSESLVNRIINIPSSAYLGK